MVSITCDNENIKDYPLKFVRKTTPSITVTVTDNTGTVINLTDYSMKMTVKRNAEDSDASAIIGTLTATISAPATGIGVFSLSTANTDITAGEYFYDIKVENSGGTIRYVVVGPSKFTIIENITKG